MLYGWHMDAVGSPTKGRRGPAHNRKLNEKRVKQLAAEGFSTYEIARSQGVNQSNVARFLAAHSIQKKETEAYKINRADLLAHTGSRIHALIASVAESIEADVQNGVVGALAPDCKGKLARDLSVIKGVLFDKERLERGQSTQNVSLIGKMMGSALDSAYKTPETTPIEGGKLGS